MMMKSVFWWRKPEYPEETTDLRQVTDETFHTYGLCPVGGLNLGRSGVKQSELRRDESGALARRATAVYWGLTPQQQPGSYQGGQMMMMKQFSGGGNRSTGRIKLSDIYTKLLSD